MKRLMLLAALGAGFAVAGCEDSGPRQVEAPQPPMDEVVAPSAEDQGVPAADTAAVEAPPPVDTLPPEPKTSEQTVQPESETLFY